MCEINIYDDKVSIISFGEDELVGMIIESHEIADTQRAIFAMAWSFAGRGGVRGLPSRSRTKSPNRLSRS